METTLRELLELFTGRTELSPTPTPKALKEETPLLSSPDSTATIYPNGYALYNNGTGNCVLWIPGCRSYTYRSANGKETRIPEDLLGGLPWYIAVTLYGEDASAENVLHRKGDRPGSRALVRTDKDEHEVERAFRWRSGNRGESPENRVLRMEQIRSMLDALTPAQKQILVLHRVYGYSLTDIARMKGVSVSAVSKSLWRARRKLYYRKVPF